MPLRRSPRPRGGAFLLSRADALALKSLHFSGWVRFAVLQIAIAGAAPCLFPACRGPALKSLRFSVWVRFAFG
jgi:hypothetical protein